MAMTENNVTSCPILQDKDLQDFQLGLKSKIGPSVATCNRRNNQKFACGVVGGCVNQI